VRFALRGVRGEESMNCSVLRVFLRSVSLADGLYCTSAQATVTIPATDPDFEIVIFPYTQYYTGQNAYVFRDQANWVVAQKKAGQPIRLVIGVGDIVDGGGYPVDSSGNVI